MTSYLLYRLQSLNRCTHVGRPYHPLVSIFRHSLPITSRIRFNDNLPVSSDDYLPFLTSDDGPLISSNDILSGKTNPVSEASFGPCLSETDVRRYVP